MAFRIKSAREKLLEAEANPRLVQKTHNVRCAQCNGTGFVFGYDAQASTPSEQNRCRACGGSGRINQTSTEQYSPGLINLGIRTFLRSIPRWPVWIGIFLVICGGTALWMGLGGRCDRSSSPSSATRSRRSRRTRATCSSSSP